MEVIKMAKKTVKKSKSVEKTTSPEIFPVAPNPLPINDVPSSRSNIAFLFLLDILFCGTKALFNL